MESCLSMLAAQGLKAVLGLQAPGPNVAILAGTEEDRVILNESLQITSEPTALMQYNSRVIVSEP